MSTQLCPCDNQTPYHQCCELVHLNHASALSPEKLMRSRYSAYVLGLVDFIIKSYHPSTSPECHRDAIAQTAENHWENLQILSHSIEENGKEGFVEFKAHYLENGHLCCLHEISRFVCEENNGEMLWYYLNGQYPKIQKIHRNDPCPCGSTKKYKKCCA